jgi:hypothetical protein
MRHFVPVLALLSTPLTAQQPRRLALAPATASLTEEFSNVSWVRELSDKRVIVTHGRDGRVVAADFGSGIVQQIGRKGQGPNESMPAPIPCGRLAAIRV